MLHLSSETLTTDQNSTVGPKRLSSSWLACAAAQESSQERPSNQSNSEWYCKPAAAAKHCSNGSKRSKLTRSRDLGTRSPISHALAQVCAESLSLCYQMRLAAPVLEPASQAHDLSVLHYRVLSTSILCAVRVQVGTLDLTR
jgi:hypothetical protein